MSLIWLLFFWFSGALLWVGIAGYIIWVAARYTVCAHGLDARYDNWHDF